MDSPTTHNSVSTYHVATFYKFTSMPDAERWQTDLRRICHERSVKGTILLAEEGINATIAGARDDVNQVLARLRSDDRFDDVTVRWSKYERRPFQRMKVRLKSEIVTIGDSTIDPTNAVGEYVEPSNWNQLLEDPTVTVIDTRNDFEVSIGTFDNAVNPKTESFRDFKNYVDTHLSPETTPKVALFCTGGIRCEKATSFMIERGFEDVYHLEGGILNYLTSTDEQDSRWNGECFVFDERISVTHGAQPGSFKTCQSCGQALSKDVPNARSLEAGICCADCVENPSS